MPTENEYQEARRIAADRYLRLPDPAAPAPAALPPLTPRRNVVGVGLGRKVVGGEATGEVSVRFYVIEKSPNVEADSALPPEINGVPTDVIATGRFEPLLGSNRDRLRPCQPGGSVGFITPL